jgi:hypothetical protein
LTLLTTLPPARRTISTALARWRHGESARLDHRNRRRHCRDGPRFSTGLGGVWLASTGRAEVARGKEGAAGRVAPTLVPLRFRPPPALEPEHGDVFGAARRKAEAPAAASGANQHHARGVGRCAGKSAAQLLDVAVATDVAELEPRGWWPDL